MRLHTLLLSFFFGAATLSACGDDGEKDFVPPDDLPYGVWLKIEPEGKVCGDGSQYKFFVNLARGSDDIMVMMEPGGACWDYASCSGGARGAANPDGIPDDHMDSYGALLSPLLLRSSRYVEAAPTAEYNMVFVPYCTGDIHAGNRVVTYEGPEGRTRTVHHKGAENVRAVGEWLSSRYGRRVDHLFVTGCSAGGAGSIANYYFLRRMFDRVGRGVMLNDSGPIFPESEYSDLLHAKVRESWDVDSVLEMLPGDLADLVKADFGNINALLAEEFPNDRLANTFFRQDMNYSLYSYERFHAGDGEGTGLLPHPPRYQEGDDIPEGRKVRDYKDEYREAVHEMWWEDTKHLLALSDQHENLGYYIPFFRETNSSHCTTIIDWSGTEIEEEGLDMFDYIEDLLHGSGPIGRYVESTPEGEFAELSPDEPWPLP